MYAHDFRVYGYHFIESMDGKTAKDEESFAVLNYEFILHLDPY